MSISNYLLAELPIRRHISINEPFFADGNQAFLYHEQTVNEDIDFLVDSITSVRIEEFACSVKRCMETFTSPLHYNRHFDMLHRYRCETCHRNFSSNYLLSLHISESHDAYFEVQKQKNLAIFKCLVESCERTFKSSDKRRMHLIDKHKYPPDFRFNAVKRVHQKYQKRKKADKKVSMTKNNGDNGMIIDSDNTNSDLKSNYKTLINDINDVSMTEVSSNDQKQKSSCEKMGVTFGGKQSNAEHKRKIPTSICFGRGVQKGFSKIR